MKTPYTSLGILCLVLVVVACSRMAEKNVGDPFADEWPAMDSFHDIIAEVYHPYKDSANLAPVKKLADAMALEAGKWQAAPLPEQVNTEKVKAQLEKLKTDTQALADRIKAGADDKEIGTLLTALHDNFHTITEAWYGGEEKHEH